MREEARSISGVLFGSEGSKQDRAKAAAAWTVNPWGRGKFLCYEEQVMKLKREECKDGWIGG